MTVPREVQFGDLILAFTTEFEERWTDKGSGADKDVGFYHPKPPQGFYPLGSIGVANHNNPKGKFAALCVKEAHNDSTKPALAAPVDWRFIWSDQGSGANEDGSCWRPLAPQGYVALGDVFVKGYNKPQGVQVMCVAQELVYAGVISQAIWTDAGSGAQRDFSAWQISTSQEFRDSSDGLFAVNSFVGEDSYTKPSASAVAYTLRLPLPTMEASDPPAPTLTSRTTPPPNPSPSLIRTVTVPFTAIIDGDKNLDWQVANSPFYEVQRFASYDLLLFDNNNTSQPQTTVHKVTTGITKEESQTFSINTGISVSYEAGVDLIASGKVTATISVDLGYSATRSVSMFESKEVTANLTTPPERAGALWTESTALRLVRGDGTPVGPPLAFKPSTSYGFVHRQFPSDSSGGMPPVSLRLNRRRLR